VSADLLPELRQFEADGVKADENGLVFTNPDLPWERYEELGDLLGAIYGATKRVESHYKFLIGDLLNAGPKIYGEENWAQIEHVLTTSSEGRMAGQTQRNVQSICNRVPHSRRRATTLSFEHHAEVASLEPKDQTRWLREAEKGGMSKATLRALIKAERDGHPDVIDPEPEICPTCHRPI